MDRMVCLQIVVAFCTRNSMFGARFDVRQMTTAGCVIVSLVCQHGTGSKTINQFLNAVSRQTITEERRPKQKFAKSSKMPMASENGEGNTV